MKSFPLAPLPSTQFHVTAHYQLPGYKEAKHNVTLIASKPDRAAVEAVLQGHLPAFYIRYNPIYWSSDLFSGCPWPEVIESNQHSMLLGFGDEDSSRLLELSIHQVP
ncbi:hypothetical protein [Allochromatium palmeri]|uniref:Uncharacterized protein n=1 Tax=Allochromatium palmeri TaxID=231048 RepID=A0A6N8EGF1_9GAMM|nr:hypothetical protein [Allochromatium palmeri]MTW22630.1 hypothetical protein [Allochromatium palmeri]